MGKSGLIITGFIFVLSIIAGSGVLHAAPICGDTNDDGVVNISDAVYLIGYLFKGGPDPLGDADFDQCGSINMSDVIYLFDYVFKGGPAPCAGSVDCILPTGTNTITLGCPTEVPNTVDSFSVPVYLTSDTLVSGFSFGFAYNSSEIEISSIEQTGTILSNGFILNLAPNPADNNFKIYMFTLAPDLEPLDPQENGLLFKLWFRVHGGASAQEIDIDTFSAFPGPDIEFILSAEGGGTIRPNYSDCGTSDIIITGESYICGDANSDGEVNIVDAVYIVRYVFTGGYAPEPMAAGDANCDDIINVSDVVWLINYIFMGGNLPCDLDGDGLPDC